MTDHNNKKSLKDIGTLVKPDPNSTTQFEPLIQYTLEERREFAETLGKRIIKAISNCTDLPETNLKKGLKYFLDSEGL